MSGYIQRRRLPSLGALKAFESAARHQNFTKAGQELCVTQAAVSHHIRTLEDWFDTPLFRRTPGAVNLTAKGKKFSSDLHHSFDLIADATDDVLRFGEGRTLKIATLDSFAAIWLMPRMQRFHSEYPNIDIRFGAALQEIGAVDGEGVDIEIRYGNGNWPNLCVTRILQETIFPVCSPKLLSGAHSLQSLQDLRYQDLLHDDGDVDWVGWLGHFNIEGVDASRGHGFSNSHLVLRACIEGMGVALGRDVLVADAISNGELVRPFGESLPSNYGYYLVCRMKDSELHSIKAFSSWLKKECEEFAKISQG